MVVWWSHLSPTALAFIHPLAAVTQLQNLINQIKFRLLSSDMISFPTKLLQLPNLFLLIFPLTALLNVFNEQRHGEIKQDLPGRLLYAVLFLLIVQVLPLLNIYKITRMENSTQQIILLFQVQKKVGL